MEDQFLIYTATHWEEPPRARHQLARALARKGRVYFVAASLKGRPRLEIREVEKGLTLIQPYFWFPHKVTYRVPVISELYQFFVIRQCCEIIKTCLIVNFCPSAWLLNRFSSKVVYFCNDDFLSKKRSVFLFTRLYFSICQKMIGSKSLGCAAVSQFLCDQLLRYNTATKLVLTAAEPLNQPPKYNRREVGGKIKVLYVGWVSKIEFSWIKALADDDHVLITVVGPILDEDLQQRLEGLESVEYGGVLTGDSLYNNLIKTHVCIAPYKRDRDVEIVYNVPNKFWLYLQFGKPIVCNRINNLFSFPEDFVYQANSAEEFVKLVRLAESRDSRNVFEKRLEFMGSNTWNNRANSIVELFRNKK